MTSTFPTAAHPVPDRAADAGARFRTDTARHVMTISHDSSGYRHLMFRAPDTNFDWYELLTSPGLLTINGDMGTFTFTRDRDDMLGFFLNGRDEARINPPYWAQKVAAEGRRSTSVQDFGKEEYRAWLVDEFLDVADTLSSDAERADLWATVEDTLIGGVTSREEAHWNLDAWDDPRMPLEDWSEYFGGAVFSVHFLWCLWAIVAGLRQYAAAKQL
ncbi:hypothetical protein [Curtobacterium sp. MCBD17_040]|uniref:hypothetical protein n=1 Tax=Curtobacterium sp. MCBD17_040 TaxID=2175674 RepID=UPI000DA70CA5|nr:hypothetical protein [Curtobacterium sp. MCBD17_040]WIB65304.1 hypothetical protein DEI94_18025 [Curtobacterium sp. MCBD17_040]